MKKHALVVVILFTALTIFSNHNYAQTSQSDSVKAEKLKAQLEDTVCTCMSKANASNIKTVDDAQMLLMQCFMGDGMSLFADYLSVSGVDMSNMQAAQQMAMKISMDLAMKCPAYLKIMMNIMKDPNELKKAMDQNEKIQQTIATDSSSEKNKL